MLKIIFLSTYVSTDDGKRISGHLDNKQKTHPKTQGHKGLSLFTKEESENQGADEPTFNHTAGK